MNEDNIKGQMTWKQEHKGKLLSLWNNINFLFPGDTEAFLGTFTWEFLALKLKPFDLSTSQSATLRGQATWGYFKSALRIYWPGDLESFTKPHFTHRLRPPGFSFWQCNKLDKLTLPKHLKWKWKKCLFVCLAHCSSVLKVKILWIPKEK